MDNDSANRPATGHVARYAKGKNYGFIEPLSGEAIYFHLSDCAPEYEHVHAGDQVEFEYGEKDGRPCALRVRFLGNASLDALRTDFERGTVLQGYLKQIEGTYYIKDVDTHFFIKLDVSPNEVDIEEIYEQRLNQMLDYRIVRMSARNSLRAVLVERRFKPGLASLATGVAYEAEVLYEVKGGYLLQLLAHDIKGLLPCKDSYKQTIPLAAGTRLEVELQSEAGAGERLLFELTGDSQEKYLSPAALAAWQERQLGAIGPGYKATGTVKRVVNYGAFVTIELIGDALLHIKTLMAPEYQASTREEKQALGDLLAELVPPGAELAVVVVEVDGPRCSVALDMGVAANVALKDQFTQRQQHLLGPS